MTFAPSIYAPAKQEEELAASLRALCVAEIDGLDELDVCATLGLAPHGLHRLLWQSTWDLTLAFRVAERLGLPVTQMLIDSVQRPQARRRLA